MNIEYAHQLLDKYEELLKDIEAKEYDLDLLPQEDNILPGIKSMLGKMRPFLDEDKIGKFNRWLGFIQAMLLVANCYSINEMRDHNTPLEKDNERANI